MARAFPGVTEGVRYGHRTWVIGKKVIAWERAFSKADIKRYGDKPVPKGPILAVTVADLLEKEAALAANPKSFFTIPHFDGYAAVLIQLEKVTKRALQAALAHAYETSK